LTQRRAGFLRFAALGAIPLGLMGWYSAAVLGSVLALGQTQDASLFTGNPLIGLPGLLISPNRGLLVFTPLIAFSAAYLLRVLFSRATPLYIASWLYRLWRWWCFTLSGIHGGAAGRLDTGCCWKRYRSCSFFWRCVMKR